MKRLKPIMRVWRIYARGWKSITLSSHSGTARKEGKNVINKAWNVWIHKNELCVSKFDFHYVPLRCSFFMLIQNYMEKWLHMRWDRELVFRCLKRGRKLRLNTWWFYGRISESSSHCCLTLWRENCSICCRLRIFHSFNDWLINYCLWCLKSVTCAKLYRKYLIYLTLKYIFHFFVRMNAEKKLINLKYFLLNEILIIHSKNV
jgi:hypothetical protein